MQINADMSPTDAMHTSVILDCFEPFPKHSKGRQTPHAPHADEADTIPATDCFQQTLLAHDINRGADRHHLFDAVIEKVSRVAGHVGTAGSACPHVPLSVKTWRHQL